jgi:hypothetical protein
VRFEFKDKAVFGISLYCSPLQSIESELNYIKNSIQSLKPKNLLIFIDSNAESKVWYNIKDDERGNKLIEFLSELNLVILNDNPNVSSYYTTRGQSFIDLTIINDNSSRIINRWKVCEDESLSDHRFIEFYITDETQHIHYKNTKKYIINDNNWPDFDIECESLLNQMKIELQLINNSYVLNDFINMFSRELTFVCNKVFRTVNHNRSHKKSNHWWNQDLQNKRQIVNNNRRRFQRCQTDDRYRLKVIYEQNRKEYKNLLNKTKIESWNMFVFVNNNTRDNPWGIVYAIAKQKINTYILSEIRTSDGLLLTDTQAIGQNLMETLLPDDKQETDSDFHKFIRNKVITDYESNNDIEFTDTEVSDVINAQNYRKSPGLDGFTADIVFRLHSIDTDFLTTIYNKCLNFGLFPGLWKVSIVKVLKKPNKTDYTNPKSYRLISLLSIFAKILEKLLINRINYYLHSNNLLSHKKFGFTPQKSTTDAIITAINFVKRSYQIKGFAVLLALDISGAFDNAF